MYHLNVSKSQTILKISKHTGPQVNEGYSSQVAKIGLEWLEQLSFVRNFVSLGSGH